MKISKSDALTLASCIGTIVTGVLAAEGGRRAEPILADCSEASLEIKAKKTWKLFAPAVASGAVTIGCNVAARKLTAAQLAAMAGTCAYLVKNRDNLEKQIRKYVDVDKAKEIISEARKDAMKEQVADLTSLKNPTVERSGHGELLVIEGQFGRMFRASKEWVDKGLKEWADRFENGEGVCFSTLYDIWNIETTGSGQQYGYPANWEYYDCKLEYRTELIPNDDKYGEDVYRVYFDTLPMESWEEL